MTEDVSSLGQDDRLLSYFERINLQPLTLRRL